MTTDIQDLTPDERTMRILTGVDEMLSKFAEQEHIKDAMETGVITPKVVDPKLTEQLIHSLRWITGTLSLDTVDRFIDQGNLENGEVIKHLIREKTFNVGMYN